VVAVGGVVAELGVLAVVALAQRARGGRRPGGGRRAVAMRVVLVVVADLVVAELVVLVVVADLVVAELEAAVPSSPRWWSRWPACSRWPRTWCSARQVLLRNVGCAVVDAFHPTVTRCDEAGPMHECAVNLFCVAAPNWVDVYGSGVFVGPGLVLTARHNVEIFETQYQTARDRGECAGPLQMYAVHAWLEPAATIGYEVIGWSLAPWTDLAVLEVRPATTLPPNFRWRVLALDLVPPRPGEHLAAFGFDRVEVVREPTLGVHARAVTSTGVVRDLHPALGLETLRGWRVQTNARFDGGMSGGPVVHNRTGRLVGVVSEGMAGTVDDEEHISFFPMLWPLMGLTVPDRRADSPPDSRRTLLDLATEGVISAIGREHIQLVHADSGEVTNIICPMEWLQAIPT
jgi:hypothetical protein